MVTASLCNSTNERLEMLNLTELDWFMDVIDAKIPQAKQRLVKYLAGAPEELRKNCHLTRLPLTPLENDKRWVEKWKSILVDSMPVEGCPSEVKKRKDSSTIERLCRRPRF
jgi:hypothetical protein